MGIASSVLPRSRGTSSLDAIKPKHCVGDTKTRCQTPKSPRTKMARYIERSAWIRGGTGWVVLGLTICDMQPATGEVGGMEAGQQQWKGGGKGGRLAAAGRSILTTHGALSSQGFVPGISSPPLICGEPLNRAV